MSDLSNWNIKLLLENKKAYKVLEKYIPAFVNEPNFSMAGQFTLDQFAALPQVDFPVGMLEVIKNELKNIEIEESETDMKNNQKETLSKNKELTLKDKVIVITGAASGIGKASSELLASKGAKVVLVDFQLNAGQETLKGILDKGGEGIFIQADVSKSEDVQNYLDQTIQAFGKIDVLFNNAGILQTFSRFADIEEDHFENIINVNLKGVFLGMKYALKIMDEQGYGNIINTASTTGIRAEHSLAAYTASKHGVIGLTKAAALDYVRRGIRVNAICPGGVATAITAGVPQQLQETGYMPEEFPNMRIGRYAEPHELAEVVAFLSSDSSSYMTGSILLADGGLTL